MHSPKFRAKSKTLSASINASSLLASWKAKVRDDLRRQIVPDPVEFLDFHSNIGSACQGLATEIQSGTYVTSHVTRVTSEKSKGLCRLIVLPHVRDALVLQVLADALWVELKGKAPTDKAYYAPKDHAFIKMKLGLEDDYGPISEWIKFQKEILNFSNRHKYIVVTDIANYYDWIRYSTLRSVISELVSAKEIILDLLLFVLNGMVWRPDYMANHEVGLPQCDFDAPRMLAHTMLFEVDGLLRDYPNVEFARYMDDIDIGCGSMQQAKAVLRDLDLTLQSRHLRLNSGKTAILTIDQATDHFCVKENSVLTAIEKAVDRKIAAGESAARYHNLVPLLLNRWWKSGRFEKGNGQKVLKRLIGYMRVYRKDIDPIMFGNFFLEWTSSREPLLRYLASVVDPFAYIKAIINVLKSGEVVDDITPVRIATAIASARFSRRIPPALLRELLEVFDEKRPFQLFSKMWLTSRFCDHKELKRLIDGGEQVWNREPIIIRAVAGFFPIFRVHRSIAAIRARVGKVGGSAATDIFEFYENIIFGDNFGKVSKFIKAPNKSFINGITHSKYLMLLGYISNPNFSKVEKTKFMSKHIEIWRDIYYRSQVTTRLNGLPR